MVSAGKVNLIWLALDLGLERVFAMGEARIKTSEIVDVVVKEVMKATRYKVTREEVLEAWLYRTLEQLARAGGVEPLPPRED